MLKEQVQTGEFPAQTGSPNFLGSTADNCGPENKNNHEESLSSLQSFGVIPQAFG